MTPKEQAFKMIEGRIESIQTLSIEIIEHIYNAGLIDGGNDALEYAAKLAETSKGYPTTLSKEIRSLKK